MFDRSFVWRQSSRRTRKNWFGANPCFQFAAKTAAFCRKRTRVVSTKHSRRSNAYQETTDREQWSRQCKTCIRQHGNGYLSRRKANLHNRHFSHSWTNYDHKGWFRSDSWCHHSDSNDARIRGEGCSRSRRRKGSRTGCLGLSWSIHRWLTSEISRQCRWKYFHH